MKPKPAPPDSRPPQDFLRAALAEHGRWLRTVLAARGVDAGELDDVLQEVSRRAVENVDRLRDRERVAPWLYRIAATTALEHRRRSGRRRRREREAMDRQTEREPSDPLDWLLRREREALVREAVAKLPGRDAEVLMLKHAEGWSYRQLAEHLGIGEGAVQSRLHRARERLRAELARHGVTSTA